MKKRFPAPLFLTLRQWKKDQGRILVGSAVPSDTGAISFSEHRTTRQKHRLFPGHPGVLRKQQAPPGQRTFPQKHPSLRAYRRARSYGSRLRTKRRTCSGISCPRAFGRARGSRIPDLRAILRHRLPYQGQRMALHIKEPLSQLYHFHLLLKEIA